MITPLNWIGTATKDNNKSERFSGDNKVQLRPKIGNNT